MDCIEGLTSARETERWAAIEDVNGDRMAVEPTSAAVWQQLADLKQNQTRKWVGSVIVRYDNEWGFRLSPDNVTVAEATAEGLQATIRYISENLGYWLNNWGYIDAGVTELHGQSARAFSKVVSRPISQHLDFTTYSESLRKK